ncbi:MAG TPA: NAD(P)/FAD-dependent oxidoreductase [Candidatus Deferrimicrobium sp.]|nr:NAD(P)/FAD-dependent oxidoreductase [Candidatus Deferrimicrobium sp.]
MSYDAIICGAGEGGLFTAAILAKQGLKTLVLEKKSPIGGRAMCIEYQPGYIVDYGIHSIRYGKKGIIPTIFQKDLGIKLELIDYGHGKLFQKGEWVRMPTGIKDFMTTNLLTDVERETFIPLFMDIIKLKIEDFLDVSIAAYFKDKIQGENPWNLIRLLAAALMVTPEIERASMGELIYGLKEVISAGKGATYPRGGWKGIFDKLIDIISENGEIRNNTAVNKVLISNKKAEGVLLEDGTKISSDLVVVAMPAQQIFSVLPESEFPTSFTSYCKNLIPSSGISIDLGLKEKASEDNGLIAVDDPMCLAAFTSNIDPSTAPENEQLFTFLQHVPNEVAMNNKIAKQLLDNMEQLMNQMYPGIKQKIKWKRTLIIPVMDGAVNYIGQTRDKRPPVKSDIIMGLYFSGDTYNGPGLGGDIAPSSARLCAHTILNDLNKIKTTTK